MDHRSDSRCHTPQAHLDLDWTDMVCCNGDIMHKINVRSYLPSSSSDLILLAAGAPSLPLSGAT